ncbi:MAG: phosphomannomutase [Verrucomicrobiales bacterium]|nr:phosphomannomutase [Verrucomicrobiales bacterium]
MKLTIEHLMARSGVKFGTSGARGLVAQMTDLVCYAYTRGFIQYLESCGELKKQRETVAVAGDLRPSTSRIMEAVLRAAEDAGYTPVNCGEIPSPAVAYYGLRRGVPAVMVTGSHIPADRNGIKFNKCSGEVLKDDEAGITGQAVEVDDALFDASGAFREPAVRPRPMQAEAENAYLARYLDFFPADALNGLRLGIYEHSAVGRDLLAKIFGRLGAKLWALHRSDEFVPVDTEAIRDKDARLARDWAKEFQFDAIVSTDGDSDRPLLADEHGEWLRGDILGILAAKFVGADSVSTPVSSNTAVERCGFFKQVLRTRIGSPYVIASMLEETARGAKCVVGYEANGGFLLGSAVTWPDSGAPLLPLPTRDAVLPILACLVEARRQGKTLSTLVGSLPRRFTASGLLRGFPVEQSRAVIGLFEAGHERAAARHFGAKFGEVASLDLTDGTRITFASGDIVHLRPSGNAPEFRCYTEAASPEQAKEHNETALHIVRSSLLTEARSSASHKPKP